VADFLVTGTDTGVGKTVIAAALVKALRAANVHALGFKPAETGTAEGQEADSDVLARASGETTPLASPLIRLQEPLAPAVAAERAGAIIGVRDVEARIELLRRAGYTLIIEGAGGVMVPLLWTEGAPYTALDLAERFALKAIVVGRAGLGTLNHVALTVAALRARNIAVRGVVLNGRRAEPDLAERTNPAALARLLPGVPIVEAPHQAADPIGSTVPLVSALIP
jgi:dethiobiotin synthetase